MPRIRRFWRYNKRNKRWILIECRPHRKPPCRIIRTSKHKPR